jgi:hypothetical protein
MYKDERTLPIRIVQCLQGCIRDTYITRDLRAHNEVVSRTAASATIAYGGKRDIDVILPPLQPETRLCP